MGGGRLKEVVKFKLFGEMISVDGGIGEEVIHKLHEGNKKGVV